MGIKTTACVVHNRPLTVHVSSNNAMLQGAVLIQKDKASRKKREGNT